jgi:hypothetical protein
MERVLSLKEVIIEKGPGDVNRYEGRGKIVRNESREAEVYVASE